MYSVGITHVLINSINKQKSEQMISGDHVPSTITLLTR